jgi:hypothetical protein
MREGYSGPAHYYCRVMSRAAFPAAPLDRGKRRAARQSLLSDLLVDLVDLRKFKKTQ